MGRKLIKKTILAQERKKKYQKGYARQKGKASEIGNGRFKRSEVFVQKEEP